ncbi:hypothetical protein [Methylobacterium symbioticum]|uniref:Uncharacterized protein n=1 Tax=Methylobacterium symbioticum TaxID=2584084 RepID=A0A509EBF8_9HYPH|nr:hypothetical protein [Methylobacterium symbioticum]VUD71488.1 hypothetical protein MET9862_02070 [Methylobacterium symbioticum]
MTQRTLLGAVAGALLAGLAPAFAQSEPPPQPLEARPSAEPVDRVGTSIRSRRAALAKPETGAAVVSSDSKMDDLHRKMDERVRRVTRSICEGCSGGAATRRRTSAPRREETLPADPAEAPVD